MSCHCIVWCCMVLYCWLRRAGCISQDTYLLYIQVIYEIRVICKLFTGVEQVVLGKQTPGNTFHFLPTSTFNTLTTQDTGYTFHCKSPNTSSLTYCTYTLGTAQGVGEYEQMFYNALSSSFGWQRVSRIEFLRFQPGGRRA